MVLKNTRKAGNLFSLPRKKRPLVMKYTYQCESKVLQYLVCASLPHIYHMTEAVQVICPVNWG